MKDDLINTKLEQAFLGSFLINPSVRTDITSILQPQDISILRNRAIFQAILKVENEAQPRII